MFFKIYNFIKTNALNIKNIIFIILLHPNYPNSKQPTHRDIGHIHFDTTRLRIWNGCLCVKLSKNLVLIVLNIL
jgi:hypothetical protein